MSYFNFNDTINLLSKFIFKQFVNAAKVYGSYQISKLLKRPVQLGLPVFVSFEPTTSYNLRYPEYLARYKIIAGNYGMPM